MSPPIAFSASRPSRPARSSFSDWAIASRARAGPGTFGASFGPLVERGDGPVAIAQLAEQLAQRLGKLGSFAQGDVIGVRGQHLPGVLAPAGPHEEPGPSDPELDPVPGILGRGAPFQGLESLGPAILSIQRHRQVNPDLR